MSVMIPSDDHMIPLCVELPRVLNIHDLSCENQPCIA